MRVLLDECVPKRLRRELPGHNVVTVRDAGWSGIKNGRLLRLMESEGFEVFVTLDANLPHQNDIAKTSVAFVVLRAANSQLKTLLPLADKLRGAVLTIKAGQVEYVR